MPCQYVVSARNIALGCYPTMQSAIDSVMLTIPDAQLKERTEYVALLVGPTGYGPKTWFHVQAVIPSESAGKLF